MSVSLLPLHLAPMAQKRLVCVPFAGAGASVFSSWGDVLPPDIEVFALQLPGRETAARQPFCTDWANMMAQAAEAVKALPQVPTIVFGHSLGALIALDFAREMTRNGAPILRLVVGGRPWPGIGLLPAEITEIADLEDEAFIQAMEKRYGPIHESLHHPDIAEMVLPILRADLRLLASYQYKSERTLSCPISVIQGKDDPITRSCDGKGWGRETECEVDVTQIDAGHYFVDTHAAELVSACLR